MPNPLGRVSTRHSNHLGTRILPAAPLLPPAWRSRCRFSIPSS